MATTRQTEAARQNVKAAQRAWDSSPRSPSSTNIRGHSRMGKWELIDALRG